MSLERFHRAQADEWSGYATALSEMRQGRKASHWIWYIFPQLAGLGRSSMAQTYALRDVSETEAYLRDPILSARYLEITEAVAEHLAKGTPAEELMGSDIDAQKLASSMTLFRAVASRFAASTPTCAQIAVRCDFVLQSLTQNGYAPCEFTLQSCAAVDR